MARLTVEQRVQKAHVSLMNDPQYCLYSGIFMLGKTEVVDDPGMTAYTNGRDVKYGREFVTKLTDQELRGLILHENLHKAFRHLVIWEHLWKQDAQTANMACDYVINLMIYDSDREGKNVKLPEGGCFDERFRGMDAATVYKLLKKQGSSGGGGGGSGGDSKPGLDQHDWEGAKELTAEEKETLARDVDQALRQGAILAGRMNGNVPREVTEALTPKVDWRDVLRDFVTSVCVERDMSTWRKPARRWVSQDVYMPSTIGESIGPIVVAIDTSGSIQGEMIAQFLGEVKAICETVTPERIELMYWDMEVCAHETYERGNYDSLVASTKPAGGGGTSPSCIVPYMRSKGIKPECVVVLTDGIVGNDWGGEWPCPVLWGITTEGITAPVGKSVNVY